MAITQAGLHFHPAAVGPVFQQPQDHSSNFKLCKCAAYLGTRVRRTSKLQYISNTFLSGSQLKHLTKCNRPNASRSGGVRATVTANETEKVVSNDGPKERVVEIDPFEIPKASPLQTAASLALTTAIGLLLFRSVRRRAQRATGVRLRSDREESTDLLAEAKANSLESSKPNVPSLPASQTDEQEQKKTPLGVLSGAIVAGVIAYALWIFTTKVEAVFEIQKVSTNYQIRQISITVKTIVVGLAYLSTFVFAFNSIGLVLYAGQLALGLDDETTGKSTKDDVVQAKEEPNTDK